jgi:hypothetical protein
VLGELSGQDESDRGLDLSRRDGRLLVVGRELGSLRSDSLEASSREEDESAFERVERMREGRKEEEGNEPRRCR